MEDTVSFMGSVDFVSDMSEWLGVELDQPLGRHDGTVQGVRYFAAGRDRGVFVTGNTVSKLGQEEGESREEAEVVTSSPPSPAVTRSVSATPGQAGTTNNRQETFFLFFILFLQELKIVHQDIINAYLILILEEL